MNKRVIEGGAAFLTIMFWPIFAVMLFFAAIYVTIDQFVNDTVRGIRNRKERKSK